MKFLFWTIYSNKYIKAFNNHNDEFMKFHNFLLGNLKKARQKLDFFRRGYNRMRTRNYRARNYLELRRGIVTPNMADKVLDILDGKDGKGN